MTKYPAKIDDNTILPKVYNGSASINSGVLKNLRDAIIRIEKELGVKPSRIYTNVKTRLDEIDLIIKKLLGGNLVRVINSPKRGQTIIWNGSDWIADTNFLSQHLTTTGNFTVGKAISTSVSTGIINISGKIILNKIKQPAKSDPGEAVIYFDDTTNLFMLSEDGGPFLPLNTGPGASISPQFKASGDLSGDNVNQTVIGLRGTKIILPIPSPKDGEALIFDSSANIWVTGTNFGSNVISTSGNFKSSALKVTDLGSSPGILHSLTNGQIYSKNIFDADVANNAAIKGTKIYPDFGSQDIITLKSIKATESTAKTFYLGNTSSPAITSSPIPLPTSATEGTLHLDNIGNVSLYKNNTWIPIPIEPSGSAGGDLSGKYPGPISVVGISGASISASSALTDGYVIKANGPNSISISSVDLGSTNSFTGTLSNANQEPQDLLRDVTGTTLISKVEGLAGIPVSSVAPFDGYLLAYNAKLSRLEPTHQNSISSGLTLSGSAGGDLGGSYPGPDVKKIQGLSARALAPSAGSIFQVIGNNPADPDYLGFDQIDLSDPNMLGKLKESNQDPQPILGPDVTGSTNASTVSQIDGMKLKVGTPFDGYCLVYNDSNKSWQEKSISSGGNPNVPLNNLGDLGGSYPDPSVIRMNGTPIPTISSTNSPGNLLYVKDPATKLLEYGPLDLASSTAFKANTQLPSNLQEPQNIFGDAAGNTANTTVNKIQGIPVNTAIQGDAGKLLIYNNSGPSGPAFEFKKPNMEELDGYSILSGTSQLSGSPNYGKIYFGSSSKKLMAIEENGAPKEIIKASTTSALSIVPTAQINSGGITDHTVTSLPNGKILVAGGFDGSFFTKKARLYDPVTNLFSNTGDLITDRAGHTATLAKLNGKDIVVMIGGINSTPSPLNTIEYYDVESGKFIQEGGTLVSGIYLHTATPLRNGSILICGGSTSKISPTTPSNLTATVNAYIYSPGSRASTVKSNISCFQYGIPSTYIHTKQIFLDGYLSEARAAHAAQLIDGGPFDGYVLICGGLNSSGKAIDSAEIFDPNTNYFFSFYKPEYDAASIRLSDGAVLFVGSAGCFIYNPRNGFFQQTTPLLDPRSGHTINEYSSDPISGQYEFRIMGGKGPKSLASGGLSNGYILTSEIYTVTYKNGYYETSTAFDFYYSGSSPQFALMKTGRTNHTVTKFLYTLSGGSSPTTAFLICGGYTQAGITDTAEVYTYDFTKLSRPMLSPRARHSAILVNNKKIMICGGTNNISLSSYFIQGSTSPANWGRSSNGWDFGTPNSPLPYTSETPIDDVEYFDVENFNATNADYSGNFFGSHYIPRPLSTVYVNEYVSNKKQSLSNFKSIMLDNGKILICGGIDDSATPTKSSFLFDPITNLFYKTGNLINAVTGHSLTKLPDGTIILIGPNRSQIYNPSTEKWSDGPIMRNNYSVQNHVAIQIGTSAADFKIIIIGGISSGDASNKVQAYSYQNKSFAELNAIQSKRHQHSCTLLNDGTILITGGFSSIPPSPTNIVTSVEIYDPNTNGISTAISKKMFISRAGHAQHKLDNGDVIIAGGRVAGPNSNLVNTNAIEIFDQASKSFTATTQTLAISRGITSSSISNNKLLFTDSFLIEEFDASSLTTTKTTPCTIDAVKFAFCENSSSAFILSSDGVNVYNKSSKSISEFGGIQQKNTSPTNMYSHQNSIQNWLSVTVNDYSSTLIQRRCDHNLFDIGNGKIMVLGGMSNIDAALYSQRLTTGNDITFNDGFVTQAIIKEIFDTNTGRFFNKGFINNNDYGALTLAQNGSYASAFSKIESPDGYVFATSGDSLLMASSTTSSSFTGIAKDGLSYSNKTFTQTAYSLGRALNTNCSIHGENFYKAIARPLINGTPQNTLFSTAYSGINNDIVVIGGYNIDSTGKQIIYMAGTANKSINLKPSVNYKPTLNKYYYNLDSWTISPNSLKEPSCYNVLSNLPDGNMFIAVGAAGFNTANPPQLIKTNKTQIFDSKSISFDYGRPRNFNSINCNVTMLQKQIDNSFPVLVSGDVGSGSVSSEIFLGKNNKSLPINSNTFINWCNGEFPKNKGTLGDIGNLPLNSGQITYNSIYVNGVVTSSNIPSISEPNALIKTMSSAPPEMVDIGNGKTLILFGDTQDAYIFDGYTGNMRLLANKMLFKRSYPGNPVNAASSNYTESASYSRCFTATLLRNKNQVLIVGGIPAYASTNQIACNTEIFDISAEKFTQKAALPKQPGFQGVTTRAGHTSTLIEGGTYDGYVLIVGGYFFDPTKKPSLQTLVTTAELYDPINDKFITISSPPAPLLALKRAGHTATKLSDGRIVFIGGFTDTPATFQNFRNQTDCFVYNPPTNTFSQFGSIIKGRNNHCAQLLPGNKIFIFGGVELSYNSLWSTPYKEFYNPSEIFDCSTTTPASTKSTGTASEASPSGTQPGLINDFIYKNNKIYVFRGAPNMKLTKGSGVNYYTMNLPTPPYINLNYLYSNKNFPKASLINAPGSIYDGYALIIGDSRVPELFDPTSNTIFALNQPSNTNVTVSFWFKTPSFFTKNVSLLYKNFYEDSSLTSPTTPTNGGISIDLDIKGQLTVTTTTTTATNRSSDTSKSNLVLQNDTWYHVAVTFDKSSSKQILYINGVKDSELSNISNNLDWGAGRWSIGSSYNFNNAWAGPYEDIRIENYTATQNEISQLYNNGISNIWVKTGNLIVGRSHNSYSKNASVVVLDPASGLPTDKVAVIGGTNTTTNKTILEPEVYSNNTKTYTKNITKNIFGNIYTASSSDENIVFLDQTPSTSKYFNCTLTLPNSSSCKDGQVISVSISPYLASSSYTITVKTQISTNNDTVNGLGEITINKSSASFALDRANASWYQIDSGS